MRRFMMTLGGTALLLGSAILANAQDAAPPQAADKQAPMQAPQQKLAPVQAPTQAPMKAPMQAPTQSPVQKGVAPPMAMSQPIVLDNQAVAMGRPGLFRRR